MDIDLSTIAMPLINVAVFRIKAAAKAVGTTMTNADTKLSDQLRNKYPDEFVQAQAAGA